MTVAADKTTLRDGLFLYQAKAGYRFTEDALCVAAFSNAHGKEKVLDFGCGNGIILLLLYAEAKDLSLYGIELREEAYELALLNMKENSVHAGIIKGDAMKASAYFEHESFDRVVVNPPYFPVDRCRLPQNPEIAAAKTELYWSNEKMFREAFTLLKAEGEIALIYPKEREKEIITPAEAAGFSLARRETALNQRVLLAFVKKPEELYGTGTVPRGNAHRQPR